MKPVLVVALAVLVALQPDAASAQSDPGRYDLGVQIASPTSSQFDASEVGLGGRIAWHPIALVGVEAEINFYPGDFPGTRPFSRDRLEALFGMTAGAPLGRVKPFARLRPGFVRAREAPEPFACILIFPPPLACALASGRTLFAIDIGGGVEISTTRRTFARVDAGDRLLQYPGPVFDTNRTVRDGRFFSHEFRFAVGAGLRF